MKRIRFVLACLVLAGSLVACGETDEKDDGDSPGRVPDGARTGTGADQGPGDSKPGTKPTNSSVSGAGGIGGNIPGDVTTSGGANAGTPRDPGNASAGSGGAGQPTTPNDPPGATGTAGSAPTQASCSGGQADTMSHSAHCGQCDHACANETMVMGPRWPVAVALDATHVYWVTSGNEGAVLRAPLAGGAPTTLAPMQSWPTALALNATHVYWASDGTLKRIPLAGGTPERLVQESIEAKAIALDAESVYFASVSSEEVTTIMRVPLAGGSTVTLATEAMSGATAIAVDTVNVYWANGSSGPDHAVLKVARDGGEPAVLARGDVSVYGMAVADGEVYFTTYGQQLNATVGAAVMKVAADGASEPVMLAEHGAQPLGLTVDGSNVYWTTASNNYTYRGLPGIDGGVHAVPRAGGAVMRYGTGEDDPAGIAANGTRVCWGNYSDGRLRCLGACTGGACQQ